MEGVRWGMTHSELQVRKFVWMLCGEEIEEGGGWKQKAERPATVSCNSRTKMMVAWTRRSQRDSRAPDKTRCLDQGPEGVTRRAGRLGCHTQRGLVLAKDVRGKVTLDVRRVMPCWVLG